MRAHTPVRSRIRADIAQSNQRLLLQEVDKGYEARTLDATHGEKQGPNARRRDRGQRVDCHRNIWKLKT